MRDEQKLLSFLDNDIDSSLNQFVLPADSIQEKLSSFGFTKNEAKIFLFLGKYGAKSAIEITRLLKIPRTETYRVIHSLQKRGVVSSTIDHPVKFSSLPIDKTLNILIRMELENLHALKSQRNDIIGLWDSLPSFTKENDVKDDHIQILKGRNSIVGNINEIIQEAKTSLHLLCSEKNFMRLYHTDSLEVLKNTSVEIKILTTCSENSLRIFEKIENIQIRKIPENIQKNFCVMIRDKKEIILFTKSDDERSQDMIAVKTNSAALSYPIILLFEQIWLTSR